VEVLIGGGLGGVIIGKEEETGSSAEDVGVGEDVKYCQLEEN
jgi:hypothetical protein